MICLSENEFGMSCTRKGEQCPRCEEYFCWDHMDKHGCFAVHEGDTITALVDKFYEAE